MPWVGTAIDEEEDGDGAVVIGTCDDAHVREAVAAAGAGFRIGGDDNEDDQGSACQVSGGAEGFSIRHVHVTTRRVRSPRSSSRPSWRLRTKGAAGTTP